MNALWCVQDSAAFFAARWGLEVVGSVQSGEEALTFLARCSVEVLLVIYNKKSDRRA